MQALRSLGIWFGRGLTLPQRVNYLATVLTYFDGWQKAVFYLAPVVVLTTGVMPIAEVSWPFLAHFLPFYLLTFWVFEEVGRGYGRTVTTEQYNMARFAAFAWATLGLVRRKLDFPGDGEAARSKARSLAAGWGRSLRCCCSTCSRFRSACSCGGPARFPPER